MRSIAELKSASGAYHVYQVTDLSLWSAAASEKNVEVIATRLREFGQNVPPASLIAQIQQTFGRYGLLRLVGTPDDLRLTSSDRALLVEISAALNLTLAGDAVHVTPAQRGKLKAELAQRGYPVVDEATLAPSPAFELSLRPEVKLRPYQQLAVKRFVRPGTAGGVVLLACGSGKTVVGVAITSALNARTLVITPSRTIGDQWVDHFRRMTTIDSDSVVIYRRGAEVGPVTVATYQALTTRSGNADAGLGEVLDRSWGLIIYDEVHSLPADIFRQSAAVQSIRRLGLTATLVREDGRERDVFSLVGPTVFSTSWRDLERHGWIAPVDCVEIRIKFTRDRELTEARMLAAKLAVVRRILRRHAGESVLLMAHRLKEVAALAHATGAASVTGATTTSARKRIYDDFRAGRILRLALSRVANVGVDLPDASVVIQVSGAFGSRQEEAQRVGRLLRPKSGSKRATFYTLVVAGSREVEFASRRQRFLVDQGYRYRVVDADSA